MENFILSLNVVLPLSLMMALGYVLKLLGLFDDHTLKAVNGVSFKVFLPLLLFSNIYHTDPTGIFNPKLLLFAAASILVIFCVLFFIISRIEPNLKTRGALIQGIFRSNFIIFGVPVTSALFGDAGVGVASLMIAVVIPMYNILAVVALESCRNQKADYKKILLNVLKNPLIIGSVIGIVFLTLHIPLPSAVDKTITDISKIATPLALIVLGGSFNFSSVRRQAKKLTWAVLTKLVIIPCVFLPISILLGFRDAELVPLLTMFGAPAAVSTFTMAQLMDSDSDLAGNIVVFTSIFSTITIFLWIFVCKQLGVM